MAIVAMHYREVWLKKPGIEVEIVCGEWSGIWGSEWGKVFTRLQRWRENMIPCAQFEVREDIARSRPRITASRDA